MSVISGLDAIDKLIQTANSGDRPDIKWLRLAPEESVKIGFLQELDENSDNYSSDAGTAFVAVEHSHPENFRRKALCTIDTDGRCWACEQDQKHPREGWKARGKLYANVVVDNGSDAPYVAILSQGISGKSITTVLAQYAQDAGSVTDTQFRIKRTGKALSTQYSVSPVPKYEGYDPDNYELYDLERIVTSNIPYIDQEEFYTQDQSQREETPSALEW